MSTTIAHCLQGSMLEKRDRDRYRCALKDLRDYEVYKSVMETAMVRLQTELETYARENKVLLYDLLSWS